MDWVRGEKLGHGSFATVSLATPKSPSPDSPQLMAVKSCGAFLSSSLAAEKFILEELKGCPEIIRCFGDSISCENGEKLYNVLLEYAPGGNLADKVKNSGNPGLPEFEVQRLTKSLLKGLQYIHKFGYVHCDVKLHNILLSADGSPKIADFGLAKRISAKGCQFNGTPMYMSPEMAAGGDQGAPADIWALGCAVAEMAGGAPAWSGFPERSGLSELAALMMRIGVGDEVPEIPGSLSDQGKDFLGKCFVKDPGQRWTAEMLLSHPFVVDDQELDGEDEDCVAALKARQEESTTTITASTSPRCPFDFSNFDFTNWGSSATCSITSLPSPGGFGQFEEPSAEAARRTRSLMCERGPDWSVSDGWITVR